MPQIDNYLFVKRSYNAKTSGKKLDKKTTLYWNVNAFDSVARAVPFYRGEGSCITILDSKYVLSENVSSQVQLSSNYGNLIKKGNSTKTTFSVKNSLIVTAADATGVHADSFKNIVVEENAKFGSASSGTGYEVSKGESNSQKQTAAGTYVAKAGSVVSGSDLWENAAIFNFSKVDLYNTTVIGKITAETLNKNISSTRKLKKRVLKQTKTESISLSPVGKLTTDSSSITNSICGYADVKLTDTNVAMYIDGYGKQTTVEKKEKESGSLTLYSKTEKLSLAGSVNLVVSQSQVDHQAAGYTGFLFVGSDINSYQKNSSVTNFAKVELSGAAGPKENSGVLAVVAGDLLGMSYTYSADTTFYTGSINQKSTSRSKNELNTTTVLSAAGSVKLDLARVNGGIKGYKTVTLKNSAVAGSIVQSEQRKFTIFSTGLWDNDFNLNEVYSCEENHTLTSVGTVTVSGSYVDSIAGFAKVSISDGSVIQNGITNNYQGKQWLKNLYINNRLAIQEIDTKQEAKGSITVKNSKKYLYSDTVVGRISGYETVNITGADNKGRIVFVTVGDLIGGNTETRYEYDYSTSTTLNSSLAFTAAGKASVSCAYVVGNIGLFKSVALKNAYVTGYAGWSIAPEVKAASNLKGTSLAMESSTVGAICNVQTVNVNKGINCLYGQYVNDTSRADKFTVAANASLTLVGDGKLNFDAADKFTLNGSLIVSSAESLKGIAAAIQGKGEIAASAEVLESVKALQLTGKNIRFVSTGNTAVGFGGSKFENADNTAKKAVAWDLLFNGNAVGWLNGSADNADVVDTADYFKFQLDLNETKKLVIDGNFADDDKVIVNNQTFTFGSFKEQEYTISEAGLYIVGVELAGSNNSGSFSYSISLA